MSNKFIVMDLDKPRPIKYGTNALCQAEDMLGYPITQLDDSKIGVKDARILVYVPLHKEDKTITLEQVGDLIDEYGLTYCIGKVTEAIKLATQTNEDQKNLQRVI